MARLEQSKRAGDSSQDTPNSSTRSSHSNFLPAFWDALSRTFLTVRALREIDRRNGLKFRSTESIAKGDRAITNLARFARHGGPNLSHLRGVGNSLVPVTV